MTRGYIALGSNLGDRAAHLIAARDAIDRLPDTRVRRCSRVFRTAPVGPAGQDDYYNAVVEIETSLEPAALLNALLAIEQERGRQRRRRWGPRTLDLDVLLYGEATIDRPGLHVPHPRLTERAFVLAPLADLVPRLTPPGMASTVGELSDAVDRRGVEPIDLPGWISSTS